MTIELHTEHLKGFSLKILDTGPDLDEGGCFRRVSGNGFFETDQNVSLIVILD